MSTTSYCSPDLKFHFLDSPEFFSLFLHLFGCVALPVYFLGFYCIWFKTPPQMRSLKWPLLNLHVWTSLFDIGFSLLATPYLLVPMMAGFSMGLFEVVGVQPLTMIFLMTIIGGVMCVSILGIFENRFLILSSPDHPWRKVRVSWYACNYLVSPMFFSPVFIPKSIKGDNVREAVLEKLPCLPDNVKTANLFDVSELRDLILTCIVFEGSFIALQIAILVLQIVRALRTYGKRHSKRTVELQKKFMRALVVQLTLPLVIIVFPAAYCVLSAVADYYNQAANNFTFIVIASHGFFSTITMLVVQAPYRRAALNVIGVDGLMGGRSEMSVLATSVSPGHRRGLNNSFIE